MIMSLMRLFYSKCNNLEFEKNNKTLCPPLYNIIFLTDD